MESPAKAFPAGEPILGWSYESNVMMPTPISNAAATMLSRASCKKKMSGYQSAFLQIQDYLGRELL